MTLLDLTLDTSAANLACDEALLDACEDDPASELLRFWEPREYFVVAGFANKIATEVNVNACAENGVGVFRRCSGGGTVLQGPGCLNYSLVIGIEANPELHTITGANRHIMARNRDALTEVLGKPVCVRGITDLCLGDLKFSGNAQRRKRRALLFHGTFLLQFDLAKVEKFLTPPSRQPDYRNNRAHGQFLTNLSVAPAKIRTALRKAWSANEVFDGAPIVAPLLQKYTSNDWIWKS